MMEEDVFMFLSASRTVCSIVDGNVILGSMTLESERRFFVKFTKKMIQVFSFRSKFLLKLIQLMTKCRHINRIGTSRISNRY